MNGGYGAWAAMRRAPACFKWTSSDIGMGQRATRGLPASAGGVEIACSSTLRWEVVGPGYAVSFKQPARLNVIRTTGCMRSFRGLLRAHSDYMRDASSNRLRRRSLCRSDAFPWGGSAGEVRPVFPGCSR